jgi:hypothetical protein
MIAPNNSRMFLKNKVLRINEEATHVIGMDVDLIL